MTPETIIEAFKKQLELAEPGKPFQVFYMAKVPRVPVPGPLPQPWWTDDPSEWTIQIRMAVYDVPALVETFKDFEMVGFQGKGDALPVFEPITLLIP